VQQWQEYSGSRHVGLYTVCHISLLNSSHGLGLLCCSHGTINLKVINLTGSRSVGTLGRGMRPSSSRYLHRTSQTHTQNTPWYTSAPRVGFETTNPVFEWANTFSALVRAASVIGLRTSKLWKLYYLVLIFEDKLRIQTQHMLIYLATYNWIHHSDNNHWQIWVRQ
jgi:hypothetical protein